MNLSDVARAPLPTALQNALQNAAQTGSQTRFQSALADTPDAADLDPQALLAQMGGEVARTLSSALERVSTLMATGQIDRDGLRALREEVAGARRAGIMGQQLVRLAANDLQRAQERVDLTALLREALAQRQRETQARGLEVKQTLVEVALVSDAALAFSLIETLLDWAFAHAHSRAVFRLESKPAHVRLTCAFLRRHPDARRTGLPQDRHDPQHAQHAEHPQNPESREDPALNTVAWRLLQQTAAVLGLALKRRDTGDRSELRISFATPEASEAPVAAPAPETPTAVATAVPNAVAPVDAPDVAATRLPRLQAEDNHAPPPVTQTLLGRHIVVLSAQRDVRNTVRDALRPTGSMVDFVTTLDEAQRLFDEARPHAVVYEANLGGSRFNRLRASLLQNAPALAFVQITPDGRAFEVLQADSHPYASVGLDGLVEALPAALLFELSRHA